VDLPRAETGEGTATTLAISVDAGGGLWLDGTRIEKRALRERVRDVRRTHPGTRALIAADGAARHRSVVGVIDLLRSEGVNEFAINVQPSELAHDG
jgi:biopolymer transport protein ExbD